jgi:hypothetical protein
MVKELEAEAERKDWKIAELKEELRRLRGEGDMAGTHRPDMAGSYMGSVADSRSPSHHFES